jgi:phosphotransferase system HPr (HPr) family protein
MKTQSVILRCPQGLHLRVASEVSKIARQSGAAVHIRCDGCPNAGACQGLRLADACSVLQLLTLGAAAGTHLEIVAEGPEAQEDAVIHALAGVFEGGSGI